jgi:hypothetical protein
MSNLKLTTISNLTGTKSVPSETIIAGSCKAWINCDTISTGTPIIRSSFNVASVTDQGVGNTMVSWTNGTFSDSYYSLNAQQIYAGTYNMHRRGAGVGPLTSTSVTISTGYVTENASSYEDMIFCVQAFSN